MLEVAGGLNVVRTVNYGAIWTAGTTDVAHDTNHVLWNDYHGGPTTKGAAGSGWDGMKWNTYYGLQIRTGSAGATERLIIDGPNNRVTFPSGNVGIAMTNPSVALDVTGDIEYTGTITDVSDQRLKENIVGINNSISKIQGINGVYFNMIGSDKRELGVIAQNVQQVLPEAISVVDPEKGYLGVDYTSLVPVLVEAIKEQQRQIQALRQDIEQLERNL